MPFRGVVQKYPRYNRGREEKNHVSAAINEKPRKAIGITETVSIGTPPPPNDEVQQWGRLQRLDVAQSR